MPRRQQNAISKEFYSIPNLSLWQQTLKNIKKIQATRMVCGPSLM